MPRFQLLCSAGLLIVLLYSACSATPPETGSRRFANIPDIRCPLPGDSNHDGAFDQLDLVPVFQHGKYLTGAPATWEEGDWNLDGVFDQADLVAVFQVGAYLTGPWCLSRDTGRSGNVISVTARSIRSRQKMVRSRSR